MESNKQVSEQILTEEELEEWAREPRELLPVVSDYRIKRLIGGYRSLNSRNSKLVHENDELMAENVKLRNVLIKLHAHMDFAEPIENNEPMSYSDASGINAVFEEAIKALEVTK